jgi:hypothetical protein
MTRPAWRAGGRADRDLVGEGRLAARQGVVPADPELVAVDDDLQPQAEALAAVRVADRVGDDTSDRRGLGVALDCDLAINPNPITVAFDRP